MSGRAWRCTEDARGSQFSHPDSAGGDSENWGILRAQDGGMKPDVIVSGTTFRTRLAQLRLPRPHRLHQRGGPGLSRIREEPCHPGGNITGVSMHNLTLWPKRLRLIRELLPRRGVATIMDGCSSAMGIRRVLSRVTGEVHSALGWS